MNVICKTGLGCFLLFGLMPSMVHAELYKYTNEDGVTVLDSHDRKLKEQERLEAQRREKEIADENLLRLYSTPADVIRARDTKLSSINGFIVTQQGNLQRLESQKRQLQSELADIERSGGTIGRDRINRINTIDTRMDQIKADIDEKRREIADLRDSYGKDLRRVKELYDLDPGR